jgi:hypothetical protein
MPYTKESFDIILNAFKTDSIEDLDILLELMDLSHDLRFYIDIFTKFHTLSIEHSRRLCLYIKRDRNMNSGILHNITHSINERYFKQRYGQDVKSFSILEYVSQCEFVVKMILWYLYNVSLTISKETIDNMRNRNPNAGKNGDVIKQWLDVKIDDHYVELLYLLVGYGTITKKGVYGDKFMKILANEWNKFTYPWHEYIIPK